jgi:hypothetical protein
MPEPFYFISYSPVDGEEIALTLGDQLAAGPPSIPIWLAARNLQAGIDRDEQIVHALAGCGGLLYVMTTDGVHPDCECRQEWTRALKYKKVQETDHPSPLRPECRAALPIGAA